MYSHITLEALYFQLYSGTCISGSFVVVVVVCMTFDALVNNYTSLLNLFYMNQNTDSTVFQTYVNLFFHSLHVKI